MIQLFLILALFVGVSVGEDCACATGNVHARSGAGTSHAVIGTLSTTKCVAYRGEQQTAGGLNWAHVTFDVPSQCACATANVHIRDGAGTNHNILATLSTGSCVPYEGDSSVANGLNWSRVTYSGQDGWIATKYLSFESDCSGSYSGSVQQLPGCPHIVSRAEWGARTPTRADLPLPSVPQNVYIHHGASSACTTQTRCSAIVRQYQNYHMDGHHWPDLGYSFVIGEDGNVYEGHGWGKIGTHTLNHNSDGLGFCVIGDFTNRVPNDAAINALKELIDCGVKNGKIRSDYIIKGHRDVRQTECPGQKFYELIQTWDHYNAN